LQSPLQITCHAAVSTVPVTIVTVTNLPADGNKLTVNGVDRTAKTVVSAVATQFQIGATTNATAANLWTQLQSYPLSGLSSHNLGEKVYLIGSQNGSITASMTGSWGTIVTTNWTLTNYTLILPLTSWPPASRRPIADLLIDAISTYPTNRVSATAPAFLNYFSVSQANVASGSNVFTSSNLFTGITMITNPGSFFANGAISNAWMTNMQSLGVTNAYIQVMQAGALIVTNTAPAILYNETDAAANEKYWYWQASTIGGVSQLRLNLLNDTLLPGTAPIILTRSGSSPLLMTLGTVVKITTLTNTTLTNCIAGFTGGVSSGVQETNVVGLHGALFKLAGGYLDGVGATNLVSTNALFTGTNAFSAFATTETVNSSLANGPNVAVNFGTASFVTLLAGPTGAFTIGGLVGGYSGATITIFNHTGQNMTIANDNTDPTAANRILTLTGADMPTTGDGAVTLKYSASASRWIVMASAL
jgi:hypothetical protein